MWDKWSCFQHSPKKPSGSNGRLRVPPYIRKAGRQGCSIENSIENSAELVDNKHESKRDSLSSGVDSTRNHEIKELISKIYMKKMNISVEKRNTIISIFLTSAIFCMISLTPCNVFSQNIPDNVSILLDKLPLLSHDRGTRALLYQYSVGDLSSLSDKDARWVVDELAKRGVGVITFWGKGDAMESGILEGLRIARIQVALGLQVAVDASKLLYGFYDGTAATAHIDDEGKAFSDSSFKGNAMGCPFTIDTRAPVIKSRVTAYAEAYKTAGITIDIVTADWEIDGPLEWNDTWKNSKRCVRCQDNIPNIQDFRAFQSIIRSLRSRLMNECYTSPILQRYPKALVTNYATYPNDGWRYWYDFFENPQPELPHRKDQEALYRPWYDEFTETGFTMAMPVVYTWYPIFNWYPKYSADYRWFYDLLKVGSNAGENTPSGIPIATFMHWHTTTPPANPDPNVKQMSQNIYKELLWHLLFRGTDMYYSWCMKNEIATEMSLLQEVYNNSLEYNDWIQWGRPITFEVPEKEKSVVSGLKLNNRVLIRRTDFTGNTKPITLNIDGVNLVIPYKPGECQILSLDK